MKTYVINTKVPDMYGYPYSCVTVSEKRFNELMSENLLRVKEMSKTHYYTKKPMTAKEIKGE